MTSPRDLSSLQKKIWDGSIPLEIRLAPAECRTYNESDPYLIQAPRLSYIPFLLPRLHQFFASALIDPSIEPCRGWLSFENVPLKWHHPIGLLYDLYSGTEPSMPIGQTVPALVGQADLRDAGVKDGAETSTLPWKLTLRFTEWPEQFVPLDPEIKGLHDAFINGVKEADFLRNGTAKAVMSLSKDSSDRLWTAVKTHDLSLFNSVNQRLVSPPGSALRHVPMKLYLPSSPPPKGSTASIAPPPAPEGKKIDTSAPALGSLRVIQALVTPQVSSPSSRRHPQTLGTALNTILPALFPSRRSPLLAQPVLHGAVVPLGAPVEELVKSAAYADGFLHIAIVMMV